MKRSFLTFLLAMAFLAVHAQDSLSITLDEVKYPHPVQYMQLVIEGQPVKMAYMDVKPATPNGKTVMLFHGKNFGGYYWGDVINRLTTNGYRVVVPDQVGFGKSSKAYIHYSFHLLADLSRQLLDTLSIDKVYLLGHSMGGMLATRFSLLFPNRVSKLLLENPIGLEDYRTFVPYVTVDQQYQTELKASYQSVKKYYEGSYFTEWKPEYDYLVRIGAGPAKSRNFPRYAKVAALTNAMIMEQPVCYEFSRLKVPTVLLIGKNDNTIVGKALLSPSQQLQHGKYALLGPQTARQIPGAKLVEFAGVKHIPHIEITERFLQALITNLN